MEKHILVPVDDSERSDEAFAYALREYGKERITAIHVIDPHLFYTSVGIEGEWPSADDRFRESIEDAADQFLESKREQAATSGVDIETVLSIGPIANSIVDYAEEHDIDHIVMGSHGRSGASRILLGSVAERVTRRAPVSVTVVR